MNVVIFGKGLGKPRQLNLSGVSATLAVLGVVASLAAVSFAGGYLYSSTTGSGVSANRLVVLGDEVREQQESIAGIRQQNEDTLDALAIRIAEMNARVIRLDALGRRLTEMAEIDDGEFDFDSTPALGGPEEPVETGSNIAIPEVVDAVAGRIPVLVDGGVRRGTDVFKALAIGADAVCIGRPYLWGLTAFGQSGVERVLAILDRELRIMMQQAGTPTLASISRNSLVGYEG